MSGLMSGLTSAGEHAPVAFVDATRCGCAVEASDWNTGADDFVKFGHSTFQTRQPIARENA